MAKETRIVLALLIGSFGVKALLISLFPMVYGGDSVGRILHKDQILFSVWLPGLQAIVYFITRISDNLYLLRSLMALIATLAGGAFYFFIKKAFDGQTALWSLFFFLFSPIAIYLSLVPYQEMLFVTFSLFGLFFYQEAESKRHMILTSLFLGLACITRYEGWILAFVMFFFFINRRSQANARSAISIGRRLLSVGSAAGLSAILFGWAPLLVLASGRFSTPEQNPMLISLSASSLSLQYAAFFFKKLIIWSNPLLFVLVGASIVLGYGRSLVQVSPFGRDSVRIFFMFVLAIVLLLFLIVSDNTRYNTRFVFLPSLILAIFAGRATSLLPLFRTDTRKRHVGIPKSISRIVGPGILLATLGIGIAPIYLITRNPEIRLPYEIASFLNGRLSQENRALLLCRLWKDYPDIFPLEYTRVVAQSGYDTSLILPPFRAYQVSDAEIFLRERDIRYIVLFSNFSNETTHMEKIREYLETRSGQFRRIREWPNAMILEVTGL